jgi:hypothetical protein
LSRLLFREKDVLALQQLTISDNSQSEKVDICFRSIDRYLPPAAVAKPTLGYPQQRFCRHSSSDPRAVNAGLP